MESLVYRTTSVGFRAPEREPQTIVVDAPAPVTRAQVSRFRQLRERWPRVPTIVMTATDDPSVLSGFLVLGADDFATHSDSAAELVVRIRWQLAGRDATPVEVLEDARGLTLDATRHALTAHGLSVPLTVQEYVLYSCLAKGQGAPVSREAIACCLRKVQVATGDSAEQVSVYVCFLRRKLARLGFDKALRTVRGKGYSLIESASSLQRVGSPAGRERPRARAFVNACS